MNIRNISDVNAFISDSTQYKGEIFVNVNANTQFSDIKNFIDTNNLIAFIPSQNAIYAQGHTYKGITDAQISQLQTFATNITELQNKLYVVNSSSPTDHDSQSIIGSLTYGSGEDQITSSNVTQFVISVLTRIEAGDSAITTQLDDINDAIDAIEAKLSGINGTVKDYVDNVNTSVLNLSALMASGAYATRVEAANNDNFIEVELIGTQPQTEGATAMVPPYSYRVKSKNTIASKTDLQQLQSSLQTTISNEIANILGEGNINASYDTIKEISDWIINHPNSTQIVSDINLLKQKVSDLLGIVTEEYTDPETGETLTRLKKFTSGNLSGQDWATSIQQINEILANVSFAQGVQDNAEANKIDELDFASQNATTLTGDNNDTSVKFGSSTLTNKHAGISINLTLLEKIKTNTLTLAATDAQTKATTALNSAKAYTDDKLSWIVL